MFIASVARADAPAPKDKFHLYLLIGQSNMAGRGKVEEIDRTPHPRIFSLGKSNEWVPAVEPLHFDKSAAGVGPGFAFARAMIEAEKDPAVRIGLIPCAVGGSPIASWQPGALDAATKTHPWDDMIKRLRAATESGTLKGILWHQGESDSTEKLAPGYGGTLEKTLGRLRDEINMPDVPLVVGQLFLFKPSPAGQIVNTELTNFPKRLAYTGLATAEGMNHKGDNLHLDAPSARTFGQRYAAEMLRLQSLAKPQIIKLWEQGVPAVEGAKVPAAETRRIARVSNVSEPTLAAYLPAKDKANGAAVLVCPGGGYGALAIEKEGECVARWLNDLGVAAFVLKYRLKDYPQPAALMDAQQAIRIIRERATEFAIDPAKVGAIGFSAGGHLAAYASTADAVPVAGPQYGKWKAIDSRPNFSILVYSVLPLSAESKPSGGMYSALTPTKSTPPAFLVHAKDDKISASLSENYAAKLNSLGIASEVHLYETGGHGFGLGTSGGEVARWPEECAKWLKAGGWIR